MISESYAPDPRPDLGIGLRVVNTDPVMSSNAAQSNQLDHISNLGGRFLVTALQLGGEVKGRLGNRRRSR
jgi:hypothetical protein